MYSLSSQQDPLKQLRGLCTTTKPKQLSQCVDHKHHLRDSKSQYPSIRHPSPETIILDGRSVYFCLQEFAVTDIKNLKCCLQKHPCLVCSIKMTERRQNSYHSSLSPSEGVYLLIIDRARRAAARRRTAIECSNDQQQEINISPSSPSLRFFTARILP